MPTKPGCCLGEVGKGYRVAIDHAIAYTRERKQFGKAIADFQSVQHQIARAATEIEAARLMVYNAARLRDAGEPFLTQAAMCPYEFASTLAAMIIRCASEVPW
jgi:short/branched chain acyl-CoA dehydrogenase